MGQEQPGREKMLLTLLCLLFGVALVVMLVVSFFVFRENRRLHQEYSNLESELNQLEQKKAEQKVQEDAQEATTESAREEEQEREKKAVAKLPEGTEEVECEEEPSTSQDGWGRAEPIPEEIQEKMKGISMPEGVTQIGFDDLAYLTLPHYNFEGEVMDGHMIVNQDVAEDVVNIFKELYDIQYPIQRMELIDKFDLYITDRFDSLDRSSMGRNNTSCFCYRVVNGSSNMSNHAWGRAIDLNPLINPWVQGDSFSPRNAGEYVDRSKEFEDEVIDSAVIRAGDEVVQIFEKYGWSWGGYWSSQQDYQHFEKEK